MMVLLYLILGFFARRTFGGMLNHLKFWGNRGVQTTFMIALFLSIYVTDYTKWQSWLVGIIIAAWLQFQEISRGHGACFDIGRWGIDETLIKRYNARWYYIPCDYCANKGYFEKYGVVYDFMYMTLRYTAPMLPMALIDSRYLILGFGISVIYALCWELYEWKPQLFTKVKFIGGPTQLAECIWGGWFFAGCYWIGL